MLYVKDGATLPRLCRLRQSKEQFTFPIIKLLDYAKHEGSLESAPNPFGIVLLAYLKTRATRRQPEDRLHWKLRLCKLLYERGYSKKDILELARFIDWLMILPETLETRFDEMLFQYEEEQKMRYVTTFERYFLKKGEKKGRQEGRQETLQEAIIDTLKVRFDEVSDAILETIHSIDDLPYLKQLHQEAVSVSSLKEFQTLLDREPALA